jgi:LmbE family N-acetylglucosaminyl deacetylase
LRIICFGAHPDDCEIKFGGTASKLAAAGHAVKFVSVSNGAAGHREMAAAKLAERRLAELKEAGRRIGVAESATLGFPDGGLQPDLTARAAVISQIRSWQADFVISHRLCDYHPDHRYTAQLVQDAAYLVVVPLVAPETPALRKNPVFMYFEDDFKLPNAFQPDVVIDIDDAWEKKILGMDAHVSQFYEWLPYVDGKSSEVPQESDARRKWLRETWARPINPSVRAALQARYGAKAAQTRHAESLQVCEYGRQPSAAELNEVFPK